MRRVLAPSSLALFARDGVSRALLVGLVVTTFSPASGAAGAAEPCPRRPPQVLSRSIEILPTLDAAGWRPTHAAIAGRRVAVIAAPLTEGLAPGRVYLYDPERGPRAALVAEDAAAGLPTWWGHMHYKAGAVALTSSDLAYCAETGYYDALRVRSLEHPGSVHDVPVSLAEDDELHDGIEVPFSCTNVATENRDEEGIAFVVSRPVGMKEYHHIVYLHLQRGAAEDAVEVLGRSAAYRKLDPENPYLYNRGPQAWRGTVAWEWGSHRDKEATARLRLPGPPPRVVQLDGTLFAEKGIERVAQISLSGERVAFEAGNDLEEAFEGVAVWDAAAGSLSAVAAGALSPSLWGDVLLVSWPEGIFKLDLAAPDPATAAVQLTANDTGAGARGHSATRLGGDGLFVYLRMTGEGGEGASVRLASLWRSDANLDGRVDAVDLARLEAGRPEADFNHDGIVDEGDWEILNAEWGASGTGGRPRGGAPRPEAPLGACVTPTASEPGG